MSRMIIALLVAAVVCSALAQDDIECPPNQVYKTCGSACPPTCRGSQGKMCIQVCVKGCQCKGGYVLNDKGECVLQKDC